LNRKRKREREIKGKRDCEKGTKDRRREYEKEVEREGGREWDRRYKYIIFNIHKEIEKRKS
jgi:hypothetical protein